MSEKRRDNKGRILQKGESQRKDLTYQYRFTDQNKKRQTIYAPTLAELREKEKDIQRQLALSGGRYIGQVTILDMMNKYLKLKRNLKRSTRNSYEATIKRVSEDPFFSLPLKDIKKTDVKAWAVDKFESGTKYHAIESILRLMKPAIDIAVEDDCILSNPSRFNLKTVLQVKTPKRQALSKEQQQKWLEFIKNDSKCKHGYDIMVVLLGTGMRVSELCGLTWNDLDFEKRLISINHQLCKAPGGDFYIETPKSETGERIIPMTDDVYDSLQRMVAQGKACKVKTIVDGYYGFVAISQRGTPHNHQNIDCSFQTARRRFHEKYPDYEMPKVTPHILRHTFCTNMANAGMKIKNLQYLMGHASVTLTLDRYTHSGFDEASKDMLEIINR